MAGFAQTNTFATPGRVKPTAPPPAEPAAAPIAERPAADFPPVSSFNPEPVPEPTAFVQQPVEQSPVETEPPQADAQNSEYISPQAPESQAAGPGFPDLNSLAESVSPAEASPEPLADDDFEAFSADALERYFSGQGEMPGAETGLLSGEDELGESDFGLGPLDPGMIADAPPENAELPDISTGVQPFEARYDQHPEVPLGDFDEGLEPTGSYQTEAEDLMPPDADFLEGENLEPDEPAAKPAKTRRVAMVASALVGALALGGVLAFAYKNSGIIMGGSGEAPLIQADNRPSKVAPDDPGGKKFPHKNKLIYDRLQGDETPEVEKIVPRQEEVASNSAAAGPQGAAPQAAGAQPAPDGQAAPGTPKKVKTLIVKPDGTVMQSENAVGEDGTQVAAANPQTPPAAAAPAGAEQQLAPATTPAAGMSVSMNTPARKPAAEAAQPQAAPAASTPAAAAAPAAGGEQYVVQVAARQSQTAALAAFADLQQRYPSLLNSYRPIIQRADLGTKGVWYRLRVGPMTEKTAAKTLCDKLKSAGMQSCLVRPHTGS